MKRLADFYKHQLVDDCLPFWFPRAVDETHGGFLRCFDRDGSLVDDDMSVWAQGRMSWMLLTLYQELEQRPEWLAWAESGLAFLVRKCVDPTDGRMFFHVARDGTPLRKRRYAFSEPSPRSRMRHMLRPMAVKPRRTVHAIGSTASPTGISRLAGSCQSLPARDRWRGSAAA